MATNDPNGSHLSTGNRTNNEKPPLPMHKRAAMGLKVNGQSNPNGAEKGSTVKKVANSRCTY